MPTLHRECLLGCGHPPCGRHDPANAAYAVWAGWTCLKGWLGTGFWRLTLCLARIYPGYGGCLSGGRNWVFSPVWHMWSMSHCRTSECCQHRHGTLPSWSSLSVWVWFTLMKWGEQVLWLPSQSSYWSQCPRRGCQWWWSQDMWTVQQHWAQSSIVMAGSSIVSCRRTLVFLRLMVTPKSLQAREKRSMSACSSCWAWVVFAVSSANSMSLMRTSWSFVLALRRPRLKSLPSDLVRRQIPSDAVPKACLKSRAKKIPKSIGARMHPCLTLLLIPALCPKTTMGS